MKRDIIITSDGSTTISLPDWNEQYHSKHGAIQEAKHVFIKHGLAAVSVYPCAILEIGFGTGLNCFITYLNSTIPINYVGVDAYPVAKKEIEQLNYVTQLKAEKEQTIFNKIHTTSWEKKHQLSKNFSLIKRKQFFAEINDNQAFNLIYFDAFGARVQPALWTEDIFLKMYTALKTNGILVTYAAKGSVRRAMLTVGFSVEKLPGPPGKREMLRATKV